MPGHQYLSSVICLVNLRVWAANARCVPTCWPFSSVMMWNTKYIFFTQEGQTQRCTFNIMAVMQFGLILFAAHGWCLHYKSCKHTSPTNIHTQVMQCFKIYFSTAFTLLFFVGPNWLHVRSDLVSGLTYDKLIEKNYL